MIKSLGEGYSLYRKGTVIAVSHGDEEIAEFPIGHGIIDFFGNSRSDEIDNIQCKLRKLEKTYKENFEQLGIMKSGDVASFDRRLNTLEELLQSGKNVTVHSRLNDMEKDICNLRKLKEDLESTSCSNYFVQQTHKHDTDISHLERKMKIVEQNDCVNSRKISDIEMRFQGHNSSPQVSFEHIKKIEKSVKNIEERFDRIDKNMNVIDMEWHHMRDGLTGMVRGILKSL